MAAHVGRKLGSGVLVLVLLGGTVLAMFWGFQRQLIYFPDPAPVPPADEVLPGATDVMLRTDDGLELGAWFVPADPARDTGFVVLAAPGNGGNRASRAGLAEELSRRGLAVLLMDYRGYGGNPGRPSEDGLAADADAAVDRLRHLGYPADHTIYYGESLGAGVVAALHTRHPPAGMVLRSPFTDLADVGSHHYPFLPVRALLRDRYPVVDHLAESEVPVTVVYGEHDSVVPTELSVRVADLAPSLVERVVIEGADHNDPVMFGPQVAEPVARLARRVG
jgi:pimeloyl-ACP methyl ester carboxylesterase